MSSVDRALSRIAHSVCTDRKRWAFVFIAIALIASFFISRIHLSLDAEDFLPQKSLQDREKETLQQQVLEHFGGKAPVVVVFRSNKKIEARKIAPLIEAVAQKLNSAEEIKKVTFRLEPSLKAFIDSELPRILLLYLTPKDLNLFSEKISGSTMKKLILPTESGNPQPEVVLNRDPLGLFTLASPYLFDLMTGFRIILADGYFAFRGEELFFILVEPRDPIRKAEDAKRVTAKIDGVLTEVRADPSFESLLKEITVTPVGRPYIYASTFEAAMSDAKQSLSYSVASIFLLLVLFYRRLAASVLVILPVFFGLLVIAGLSAWIFPSVNLFSLLFAAVLAGLGVDFSIHIGTHYWLHSHSSRPREEAIVDAVVRPGRGNLFSALTTAAAFSALAFSQYKGILQTGILTAIGIMVMLLSAVTFFPFLMSFSKESIHPPKEILRWTDAFIFLCERVPKGGVVVWGALIVIATFGVFQLRYEDHPWSVAVRGNKAAEKVLDLDKRVGMSFVPILIVSRGKTEAEAIEKDRQAAKILTQIRRGAGIAFFQSVTHLLPDESQQRENIAFINANRSLFSAERFRKDFHEILKEGRRDSEDLLGPYTDQIAKALGPPRQTPIHLEELKRWGLGPEIDRHLGKIGEDHLAITYVYLTQFPWAKGVVKKLTSRFEVAGGQREGVFFAGEGIGSESHANILKREVIQAGSIALVMVTLLLTIAFRKPSSIVMTLLPLLCSVWITLGVTGFLGYELNFLTLSVTPILLGIGIDYGIHIMERYRKERSISMVLKETGSGLTATSLTTAFAFLSFSFSESPAVREFGIVASIGLGICLLASLHLLPCIFESRRPRKF
jgi:predicted RND superfamily exporter protein